MSNTMKRIFYLLAIFCITVFFGCSDLQEDISSTPALFGPHGKGINTPGSSEFHGQLIKSVNYNLSSCQQCHAKNYSGGNASGSCYSCHTSAAGPEACNTCHGVFANPNLTAPPRDLSGNLSDTVRGVGAHDLHLFDAKLGKTLACVECHKIPSTLFANGHIDNTPNAEVTFGQLSSSGLSAPSYNISEISCSGTYCHGNFVSYKDSSTMKDVYIAPTMTGNNTKVIWNKVDGSQLVCGTSCHSLPPTGHRTYSSNSACAICHGSVIDASLKIIDKTKHINGKVDLF